VRFNLKDKVLIVIPTTAGRMHLLKMVLDSVYSNENVEITTVLVKNGSFPSREFYEYDFDYPNVIKMESSPGGHISHAMNVGMEYIEDHDWYLYQEDDLVITTELWLEKMISVYKDIDNCGALGTRLHGKQRSYNPQKAHTIESLKIVDRDTFEVYWSDGITLISGDIIREHNLRYDEHMMTVPNACINLQLLELGYENWRTELKYNHFHTPGSKTGEPKWEYADVPIDMKRGDCQIFLKYNGCGNPKIQEWIDMDTVVAGNWLISKNRQNENYKDFELEKD
jgi:glycosyltransferase involved in cell wall biosynthesis